MSHITTDQEAQPGPPSGPAASFLPLLTVRTMDILPARGGFILADTCTFNAWQSVAVWTFRSAEAAEAHAWRCINFKEGRSMRVDDPAPADLAREVR